MFSILLSSERRKTKQFDIYEMNIEITFKMTASYVVVPKVERNWHFESTLQLSEMMNKVMHYSYTTPPSLEFQPSLSPGGPSSAEQPRFMFSPGWFRSHISQSKNCIMIAEEFYSWIRHLAFKRDDDLLVIHTELCPANVQPFFTYLPASSWFICTWDK